MDEAAIIKYIKYAEPQYFSGSVKNHVWRD